jgi:hypothetical protein
LCPTPDRPGDTRGTSVTDAADVAGRDAGEPADRAWQTPVLQTNVLVPIAIALGSLLAGAIYTWFVGEDVNWDW